MHGDDAQGATQGRQHKIGRMEQIERAGQPFERQGKVQPMPEDGLLP